MNRLTVRNSEGIGVLKIPFECERCGDLQWSLPDLGNGSPIDRLAEYEDLEEQGRLLKLPCAVGDTYFEIERAFWFDKKKCKGCEYYAADSVEEFCFFEDETPSCIDIAEKTFKKSSEIMSCMEEDLFGKTVFLTREEAEAALERTKNESNS